MRSRITPAFFYKLHHHQPPLPPLLQPFTTPSLPPLPPITLLRLCSSPSTYTTSPSTGDGDCDGHNAKVIVSEERTEWTRNTQLASRGGGHRARYIGSSGAGLYSVASPPRWQDCIFIAQRKFSTSPQHLPQTKDVRILAYEEKKHMLMRCYDIILGNQYKSCTLATIKLITPADFGELVYQYHSISRDYGYLWAEIVCHAIVVEDDDCLEPAYNLLVAGMSVLCLAQPIQVLPHRSPPSGWVHMYTDGSYRGGKSFQLLTSSGGIVTVRGSEVGNLVDSYCVVYTSCSAFESEVIVLRAAIRHARDLKFRRVQFFVDSLHLFELVNASAFCQSKFNDIFMDMRMTLSAFDDWKVDFIPREGNGLANVIAQNATILYLEQHTVHKIVHVFLGMEHHQKKFELSIPTLRVEEATMEKPRRELPKIPVLRIA